MRGGPGDTRRADTRRADTRRGAGGMVGRVLARMGLVLLFTGLGTGHAQAPGNLLAELERYEQEVLALDTQIAALDTRAAEAEARRVEAQRGLDENRARIAGDRGAMRRLVRAYYTLSRRGVARLLFDAESPGELRRRVHYVLALLRRHEDRTEAFRTLITERAATEAKLKTEVETITSLRGELEARRVEAEAGRQQRLALVRRVSADAGLTQRAAVEVAEARADMDRSLAQREGSAPATAEVDLSAAFRAARGRLPRPVGGAILRGYGSSVDALTGETRSNLGVDIGASPGTPFRAVFRGVVTRSGYVRGYGQVVVLQHGSYTTLYAHANGLRVAEGQQVAQGDVLGLVGTTGLLDGEGARLHFEVRYNGTAQDPASWIGAP